MRNKRDKLLLYYYTLNILRNKWLVARENSLEIELLYGGHLLI
jgi:hypothetical protein